jgi:hypothetical protein
MALAEDAARAAREVMNVRRSIAVFSLKSKN